MNLDGAEQLGINARFQSWPRDAVEFRVVCRERSDPAEGLAWLARNSVASRGPVEFGVYWPINEYFFFSFQQCKRKHTDLSGSEMQHGCESNSATLSDQILYQQPTITGRLHMGINPKAMTQTRHSTNTTKLTDRMSFVHRRLEKRHVATVGRQHHIVPRK